MSLGIEDIHPFHQLIISLVLGLLVGLQRQWAESPLAGIRTFALISIFGTTSAILAEKFGPWVIVIGFVGVTVIMAVGHLSKRVKYLTSEHSGLVTEVAMLLMFGVGILVRTGPIWLSAAVAGMLAVVLQAKIELHGFASRFSDREIRAIMQFVLISLVVFPVVPNRTFGPLNVLNPHEVWLMVVLIVAISLAGYIIYKFWGEKAGIILGGVLGGLISSTATTLTYAKQSRELKATSTRNALLILIAWSIVYARVFLEVIVVAPAFRAAWAPLAIMFCVSSVSILWAWKRKENNSRGMLPQSNPAEMKTAITFGIIYSVILLAVAFSKEYLGTQGLTVVAILSGVTDMDAITLSTARLVDTGRLLPNEGWPIIITAVVSNVFFKGVIAGFFGGTRLMLAILVPWVSSLVAGGLLLWLW